MLSWAPRGEKMEPHGGELEGRLTIGRIHFKKKYIEKMVEKKVPK